MRSWRNRQTRTVEGRVREGMGSSPFDRTKQSKTVDISTVFDCFWLRLGQKRDLNPKGRQALYGLRKTAWYAVF
jgi:hypothetical protein